MTGANIFGKPIADYLSNHAFFDGVYIRTDSLGDCQVDRVIPIMQELQVFMCRQMRTTINRLREERAIGLNVLDVGTGSGVLGIYADRILNLENKESNFRSAINNLDCSQRALDFAKLNCEINFSNNFRILGRQRYSSESVLPNSQDIILINPPFNPTFPNWDSAVAIHASAGEIGMDSFEEWIQIIPEHLNSGGIVIGIQMSPVREDKVIAVEKLREALGSQSTIRYCRIISEDCNTSNFLEAQYQDYLKHSPDLLKIDINEWIEKVSSEYPILSLIYFEGQIGGGTGEILEDIEPVWSEHGKTWQDRIEVHRMIVNNIDDQSVVSLFQKGRGFQIPKDFRQDINNSEDLSNIYEQIVEDIREFISRRKPEKLFDFICIDAFQLLRGTRGLYKHLRSHHIAWLPSEISMCYENRQMQPFDRVIQTRQSISQFGQDSGLGYFLHPSYTGSLGTSKQSKYLSTVYPCDNTGDAEDAAIFDTYLDYANSEFDKIKVNRKNKKLKSKFLGKSDSGQENYAYVADTLDGLNVPTYEQYLKKFESKDRCFHPELQKLLDENNGSIEEILSKASKSNHNDLVFKLDKIMFDDLKYAHRALHSLAFREFDEIWEGKLKWSSYIAIPLWLRKNGKALKKMERLPDTYVGSVWLFVGSTQSERPTIEHEEFLIELMKYTWLHFSEDFRWHISKILTENVKASLISMFAHEVKHVTGALEGKLMPPITRWMELADLNKNPLFEVIKVSDDQLKKGTIAKIEVAERWVDKLQISPYSPLVDMATSYILLWCMQPSINDCPFENKLANLIGAIEECWLLSCQVCMISYFTNKSLVTLENLEIIDQEFIDLIELFKIMLQITNTLSLSDLSLFGSEMEDTGYFLNVIRMLLATFINCFKHFDPLYPVEVRITKENQKTFVEIRNNVKTNVDKIQESEFISNVLRNKKDWSERKIKYLLDIMKQRYKSPENSKNKSIAHTDEVLLSLAEKTESIYSKERDGNEYIVTFLFNKI